MNYVGAGGSSEVAKYSALKSEKQIELSALPTSPTLPLRQRHF